MSNAQQEAGPARPTSRSGRAIKASSSAHFANAGRPADTARAKTGFALEHRVDPPVASWGWNPAGRNVVMSLECNSTTSSPRTRRLANSQRRSAPQRVRAAILTCSRNHACAGSLVSRGCHAMKYENPLISRGGSNASISRVRQLRHLLSRRRWLRWDQVSVLIAFARWLRAIADARSEPGATRMVRNRDVRLCDIVLVIRLR